MVLESIQVIQDLAVVVIAALLMAALFRRLHQPVMVGYILAGVILGPYTPPFSLLLHPEILDLFAQIGIIFLLLAIGMEYPIVRLRAVGRPALLIALAEALATLGVGYAVGLAFGL
ncbi:MAG TPA: cation:proton antiporter, partial [Thermoplasmata archaeon]|nr:cation:proton antiporter [Thermoplasmata archaeon]